MEKAFVIDWSGDRTHVLLNPRLPADEQERLERLGRASRLRGHIIVATSGSSGTLKLVALSKEAVLASAAAVNERLEVTSADIWCRVLPIFHVGGLGIHARAHLAGARVISMSWDPRAFALTDATLLSLVPTQIHEPSTLQTASAAASVKPPARLRAVLIGGGALDAELQTRALAAGWPVLASYGMSECASTVTVEDVLLSHLNARVEGDGRLAFRGLSLLTGYIDESGLVDPKVDGWFVSQDVGEVDERRVRVRGRRGEFIKIGGESVDLARLDRILDSVRGGVDAALLPVADDRLGNIIHLAVAGSADDIVEKFNARVLPFERIREIHHVNSIPRSSLGKLLRSQLLELIVR